MHAIEKYFEQGWEKNGEGRVRRTALPPVYFQHPGHSMTIVGLEKQTNGQNSLLVFDPTSRDSHTILRLVGKAFRHKAPDEALQAYRRGKKHLRKHGEFEIL